MIDICERSRCTGCMACASVCAHDAILFKADEEGFIRPHIDAERCVDCGLCSKVCPVNHPAVGCAPKKVFSGWSTDEEIRMGSSSGGAFTEIARPVLEAGGVVFGCALNDELKAEHTYVTNINDLRNKLSGSKYVQSKIGNSYAQAKSFLKQGRKVLFSGTPCQIAGLRNFLRKDYPNLITVDLICHGVPSPMLFDDYKSYMEDKMGGTLTDVKFRCKKSSWFFFNMRLSSQIEQGTSKEYIGCYYEDPYLRGFLRDYFLRPCCHQCHYTSLQRVSDFTIADWWGYRKQGPQDKDFKCKGVSLMLINTEKGLQHSANMKMQLRERTIEEAKRTNLSLSRPFPPSMDREAFWRDYKILSFPEMVKKYMYPEKVSVDKFILQHYRNTDILLSAVNLLILPKRAFRKIIKITIHIMKKIIKTLKRAWHFVGNMRYKFYLSQQAKALNRQIAERGEKVIFLFCAPTHSNLGDQAQLLCWMRLFHEWYPEHEVVKVSTRFKEPRTLMNIHECLREEDMIFVHSGYLIFDIHPELPFILEVVNAFYDRPITILPQTVNLTREWSQQTASRIINSHPNLTLLCRDEVSLEKAKVLFPKAKLKAIPDVVTSLIGSDEFRYPDAKRHGVMLCVRNDVEKLYSVEQINALRKRFAGVRTTICDTTIKAKAWTWNAHREDLIRSMLKRMAEYQVIITDRFHGTIFSQIVDTPVIVISSADHKLSSGVKWFPQDVFGGNISFASSLDEAYEKAKVILDRKGAVVKNPSYFKERYYGNPHDCLSTNAETMRI